MVGDIGVNGAPLLALQLSGLCLLLVGMSLLREEGELHFDIVMDVIVILEHNVVVQVRVCLVPLNPVFFERLVLLVPLGLPFLIELLTGELQKERLI